MQCESGCDRKVHKRGLCRPCYDLSTGRKAYYHQRVRSNSTSPTVRLEFQAERWAWVVSYLGISGGSDRVRGF